MKRKIALLLVAVLAISLFGCTEVTRGSGLSAQPVKIDRKDFIDSQSEALGGIDCSQIMTHIEEINRYLTSEKKIPEEPEMWYDKELETIYVQGAESVIAFRVDEQGNVLFTSCTGSLATKGSINRAIAIATNPSVNSEVEAIQCAVAETEWLNTINSAQLSAQGKSLQFTPLDTTLDTSFGSSVHMFTFNGYPTLTEALSSMDQNIDGLYESSIMSKFWETSSAMSNTIGVSDYVNTFNNSVGEFGSMFNGYVDLYTSDFNSLNQSVQSEYFGAVTAQAEADQATHDIRLSSFDAAFATASGTMSAPMPSLPNSTQKDCSKMVLGMVDQLGGMLDEKVIKSVNPDYDPIPAQSDCDHTWQESYKDQPTCTKDGTKVKLCTKCGATQFETVKASGHSFEDYSSGTHNYKRCKNCGYKEYYESEDRAIDDFFREEGMGGSSGKF